MRPITFEIPQYQSRAPTDGQPRLPIVHEVTLTPRGIALIVGECYPPTRTGQFSAEIGKRKTAQGRQSLATGYVCRRNGTVQAVEV